MIIDDASHLPVDQIVAFQQLFSALVPGGIYVVEDLHFSRLSVNPALIPQVLLMGYSSMGMRSLLPMWRIFTQESFISYMTSYGGDMLRRAGPFGKCFGNPSDGLAHVPRATLAHGGSPSCAQALATHSVHFYTEMVVVQKRSEEIFMPETALPLQPAA